MGNAGGNLDDVIRVRIDAVQAVADFMDMLGQQAAAGEAEAPDNPASCAIYRELAPFLLEEYAYIDPAVGEVAGVYVGFADGALYSVSEEIPEPEIDALLAESHETLPPVYLYIVLAAPQPCAVIDRFLAALATHLERPLVGVFRDQAGRMAARPYALDAPAEQRERLARQVIQCAIEANRHLDKARLLRRLEERIRPAAGRAFARVTYRYAQHVLEFATAAERDDFVAWSRTLCEWVYSRWCSWEDLGFSEILRPAEAAGPPVGDVAVVRLIAPADYRHGSPWQAFGGTSAATAVHFTQSEAAVSDEALRQSLEAARTYWDYVIDTVSQAENMARTLSDVRRRQGMKNG